MERVWNGARVWNRTLSAPPYWFGFFAAIWLAGFLSCQQETGQSKRRALHQMVFDFL
jgi:hypothetical protein